MLNIPETTVWYAESNHHAATGHGDADLAVKQKLYFVQPILFPMQTTHTRHKPHPPHTPHRHSVRSRGTRTGAWMHACVHLDPPTPHHSGNSETTKCTGTQLCQASRHSAQFFIKCANLVSQRAKSRRTINAPGAHSDAYAHTHTHAHNIRNKRATAKTQAAIKKACLHRFSSGTVRTKALSLSGCAGRLSKKK
jgi:hypothetical protein